MGLGMHLVSRRLLFETHPSGDRGDWRQDRARRLMGTNILRQKSHVVSLRQCFRLNPNQGMASLMLKWLKE